MDSDKLAIIAIVISIASPIFEYIYNKSINDVNIDTHYFDIVYEEYLLEKIPRYRMQIGRNKNGTMNGVDEFIDLLRKMRKSSLYFKFANEDFYEEIRRLIQKLEDELIMLNSQVSYAEYKIFRINMDVEIRNIYECIGKATHSRRNSILKKILKFLHR